MNVLAEVLAVEEADITPTMSLQRDLGADSLDLLEIMSRLSNEFNIEISRATVWHELVQELHPDWVQRDKLTDKGLVELRTGQACADLSAYGARDLVTVDLLLAYVESKLGASQGTILQE
jgi:acyl carrier protein